jgi:hypothetical protein
MSTGTPMTALWIALHQLVAHPLLAVAELARCGRAPARRLHDWSAERAWPDLGVQRAIDMEIALGLAIDVAEEQGEVDLHQALLDLRVLWFHGYEDDACVALQRLARPIRDAIQEARVDAVERHR